MRVLAGLLFAAVLASAQLKPALLPGIPDEVGDYLGLTKEQSLALDLQERSYWSESNELRETWETLQPKILQETARSPLRPAELGYLHASRERARRRFRSREIEWIRAATSILTEAKVAKLRVLAEWSGRRGWTEKAVSKGLVATECPTGITSSNISIPEVCQEPLIPMLTAIPNWSVDDTKRESAVTYLGLTKEQQQRFQENGRRTWSSSGVDRMYRVAKEIREELARETLDEAAIGIRFAEIEALRRKETDLFRNLVAENMVVLGPEQKLKLDALREAMRLQSAVSDARSLDVLGARCMDKGVFFLSEERFSADVFFYFLGDCPDRRALSDLP